MTARGAAARNFAARCLRELGYLLPLGPIAIIGFALLLSLGLTAAATIIVWIGVPLGVATLWLARSFASLERERLRVVTGMPVASRYLPAEGETGLRRFLTPSRDSQSWRDLAHGVLIAPLAIVSWTLALTWTALALGGVTAPVWVRFLPDSDAPAEGFLGWLASWQGVTVVGIVALVSLPWLTRGLAAMHAAIGRWLLGARGEPSLRHQLAQMRAAQRAAAAAEADALRRIERDLHDGPQQQLVRLGMEIDRATRSLESSPQKAGEALAIAKGLTAQTLADLRSLSRGIAPPMLAERGLEAAIASLADRSTVPVTVTYEAPADLALGPQTAAYFVIAESLANVAKHAEASRAQVGVTASAGILTIRVTDDGRGGAHVAKGQGLAGLADRVAGAGGSLTVADAPSGGTEVVAEVPCA